MPTTLTAEQKSDLAWLNGFRGRIDGKVRPTGPDKASGWDDADALIKIAQGTGSGGGYGPKVT